MVVSDAPKYGRITPWSTSSPSMGVRVTSDTSMASAATGTTMVPTVASMATRTAIFLMNLGVLICAP